LEKLDRVLMSPCWEALFPLVTVRKLTKDNSDHNPLFLDFGDIPSVKKLETSNLTLPGLGEMTSW
jgi:hypothetical protein